MTWPPAASMRAAAAITSITMNGGTLLRPDAVSRPLARFLRVASSIGICYLNSGNQGPQKTGSWPQTSRIRWIVRAYIVSGPPPIPREGHVAPHRPAPENVEIDRPHHGGRARLGADACVGAIEGPA